MVRLKHRYLLVNILYPDSATESTGVRTAATPGSKSLQNAATTDMMNFHQPTSDKLTPQLLAKMVREAVSDLFGDYGSGMIAGSLLVKYLSPATSTAIIRVSRDHYRLVWAALSFVTKLPRPVEQSCVIQVVRVSGTIRKAEEEAIRRAKASIMKAQRQKGGAGNVLGKMLGEQTSSQDVEMGGIMDEDDEEDDYEDED